MNVLGNIIWRQSINIVLCYEYIDRIYKNHFIQRPGTIVKECSQRIDTHFPELGWVFCQNNDWIMCVVQVYLPKTGEQDKGVHGDSLKQRKMQRQENNLDQ
jgi:hypothetical protein